MWIYKGKEFTSDDIGDYIGFIYCITDTDTGMKYIGKKGLMSKRKMPPLKGMKKKRTKIVETDWEKYYGSSELVKSLVEEHGTDRFEREILHLCRTKGEMNYIELYCQIQLNALLDDNYYNGIIQCKIHRSHVKNITLERLKDINNIINEKGSVGSTP